MEIAKKVIVVKQKVSGKEVFLSKHDLLLANFEYVRKMLLLTIGKEECRNIKDGIFTISIEFEDA